MKRVIFVCTGNTCRSCMAEGFFKALCRAEGNEADYDVSSAGIAAVAGDSASENAVRVMREDYNIDISSHCSKQLNARAIADADLILTMTGGHRAAILSAFPQFKSKVFTLKQYADGKLDTDDSHQCDFSMDITDPYGMPAEVYRACAREIRDAVEKVYRIIKG